ncbi:hypothetical protein B7767_07880 [Streptomyces sp. 13-12-16]|uniref:hypothetical protein n=1 Tax=Streptomyces sp. 13-12-16 TaxID=1570823 RepID=UPI000A1DFD14|nr:hypothetical protein [Streptomyces sp. 13-12-16]OSP43875.1 hypothetical protein B7767_07880 [Streptomyces sp. 13-12-16]
MERLNTFLGRHIWAQVLLVVLLGWAVIMLMSPGEPALVVLARSAVTSVGAVAVLLVLRAREKRAAGGSGDRLVTLDRRLRHGEIPSSPADREAMLGLVEQRLHRTRHRRPALAVLCLMYALLVAAPLLLGQVRQALVLGLLGAIVLPLLAWQGGRQVRRLREVREILHGSPGGANAGGEASEGREPRRSSHDG